VGVVYVPQVAEDDYEGDITTVLMLTRGKCHRPFNGNVTATFKPDGTLVSVQYEHKYKDFLKAFKPWFKYKVDMQATAELLFQYFAACRAWYVNVKVSPALTAPTSRSDECFIPENIDPEKPKLLVPLVESCPKLEDDVRQMINNSVGIFSEREKAIIYTRVRDLCGNWILNENVHTSSSYYNRPDGFDNEIRKFNTPTPCRRRLIFPPPPPLFNDTSEPVLLDRRADRSV
jgi:hypothetical protein